MRFRAGFSQFQQCFLIIKLGNVLIGWVPCQYILQSLLICCETFQEFCKICRVGDDFFCEVIIGILETVSFRLVPLPFTLL